MFTHTTTVLGTSSAEVGLVPAEHITLLWPQIEPLLQKYGQRFLEISSEHEILVRLYTSQLDLWAGMDNQVMDGFAVCGWEVHAKVKYYHILSICGKDMGKYFTQGLDKIEKYACFNGATEVVVEGRKAWLRLLKPRNYNQRTVRLRKYVRTLWSN